MVSLEDEKIKNLAEVIANKTCKKILDLLAEKEASQKEISTELKIPLNTIGHNITKLLKAELIEKTPNYFWSSRGKKILYYRLSNKSIVISPKSSPLSKLKTLTPALLITGALAILINSLQKTTLNSQTQKIAQDSFSRTLETTATYAPTLASASEPNLALWFFAGAIITILIHILFNWRKL